ncbi:FtsX-like permease family protein [Rhizobium vallis]|uniref:FtsX-like permease family protein n=1 Tax=Rhizobium vallis TaxID=634290 RepID=A0A432PCL1_9HYPH|nr:FtsX-like permease family protein [Rhizobium vallis]RUM20444.1 FtsX-like permease family protein [Rhizobium vallis]
MRNVLLGSLRIHARRYIAAAIAVIVSVAFIVAIGVLGWGARAGLMASDGAPYRSADYVVRADPNAHSRDPSCCTETLETAAAIELVDGLGNNASPLGRVLLAAHTVNGSPVSAGKAAVGPIASAPQMRWQKLVTGRFPERPGEAVVHVWDARAWKITVGDRICLGEGGAAVDMRVVGLVESPTTWTQASVYVTWPQYVAWRDEASFHVGSVAIRGSVGHLPDGMIAIPAQSYVTASLAKLNKGTDAFALMGLAFASVAVFVSSFVIANTFSILFAQRVRDFALLRCIGATRRQLLTSVQLEAAIVGALASSAGIVAGVGLGYGLVALIPVLAPLTPMGVPALPVPWLLAGFVIGLVVTLTASWLPIRNVGRVSPIEGLRPHRALDLRTGVGRKHLTLVALLLITGLAMLTIAMAKGDRVSMVVGGASTFVAVLCLGPLLVPGLIRLIGTRLGPIGRLATENAVRNPRRTATTTAALLTGVSLTTTVVAGMVTWRTSIDAHRDTRFPIDVALTSLNRPTTADLLDRVRRTPGIDQAVPVYGAIAQISGWDTPIAIVAAPAAVQIARDSGTFAQAEPGTIRLDREAFRSSQRTLGIRPGDRITVRIGDRQAVLKVVFLGGWGQAGVVAPETLAQLTNNPEPQVVWIRAAEGEDPLKLVGELDGLADGAGLQIEDHLQARAAGDRQLNILTWSVIGLLAISVAVALIGITNALALSVLERTRENALLRALGLTRRQLRQMLLIEGMLLSLVATMLGTTIGVAFAFVGYETIIKPILAQASLVIPWASLSAVAVMTVAAGMATSVLPARRAAHITPAVGLSLG